MDPAPKLDLRRLFSLGTLCVALVIAANAVFVVWLNGSQRDNATESGGDAFPLEIRLLDELESKSRNPMAGLTEATRGAEGQIDARAGIQASASALNSQPVEDSGRVQPKSLAVTGAFPASTRVQTVGEASLNSSNANGGPGSSTIIGNREAESQALACRVWGPIGTEDVIEVLRQKIELAGDVIEVQAAEMSSDPDYLVYVYTDQNLDNARRLLKELESQSVDAYVISGGALMNSVSAGVFSRRSRAESHQQRLIEMGYDPIVEPLERSQTVYHLYARVPQGFETEGHASKDCAAIASLR